MDDSFSLADDYPDATGPKIYPEAVYPMKVKTAVPGTTSTGKVCIRLNFEFVQGKYRGETVNHMMVWAPQNEDAKKIFARSLAKLGASPAWVKKTRPSMDQTCMRIMGSTAEIALKPGEWNGEPKNDCRIVKAISNKETGAPGSPTTVPAEPAAKAPAAAAAAAAAATNGAAAVADEVVDPWNEEPVPVTTGGGASDDDEEKLDWP